MLSFVAYCLIISYSNYKSFIEVMQVPYLHLSYTDVNLLFDYDNLSNYMLFLLVF